MNTFTLFISTVSLALLLGACGPEPQDSTLTEDHHQGDDTLTHEEERGPHNGRLLRQGDFTVELAIIEGQAPQYRAWVKKAQQALPSTEVELRATLTRLGSVDEVGFTAQGDYLASDITISEPHSFVVELRANYQGESYLWQFESFEGRTEITPDIAQTLNIATEVAGPQTLELSTQVYGRVLADSQRLSHVSARFEGRITDVKASIGEYVSAGSSLATIESNQSLTNYEVTAPISGIILERDAGPGEQTGNRTLFTIMDNSRVWVDLSVFPKDLPNITSGAEVTISTPLSQTQLSGTITRFLPQVDLNQAVTARVHLDNPQGTLLPGAWVEASIKIADIQVPLAVRREALQSFRDFTVVYAKFGKQYEVRMLELGRQSADWVEVLSGLSPGTTYVTQNSYVLKADVEKDGATHDH